MWTKEQFRERARLCWDQYRDLFGWGFSKKAQVAGYDGKQEIEAALNMYLAASKSETRMRLLGDQKIREDEALMMNFGTATVSGVEDKLKPTITGLNDERMHLAATTPLLPYTPVAGSGSILADKDWTALMNDSFILGGIHARMEFILALQDFDAFDQELQKKPQVLPVAEQYKYPAARVPSPEDDRQKWKLYLKAKPEVLWNGSYLCPRVFARELIGLKTFGYVPEFNRGQLGFSSGSGVAENADFQRYITALNEAGFVAKDKPRILSSVSAFLFGDANALN